MAAAHNKGLGNHRGPLASHSMRRLRRHHLQHVATLQVIAAPAKHPDSGCNRGVGVSANAALDFVAVVGEYDDKRRVVDACDHVSTYRPPAAASPTARR
jgi:hypothetical protein